MRRAGADSGLALHDLGEQFVGMQAALHQQLGVAGSHEFDRLLGSRMTVWNIDDFKAAEIQREGLRDTADLVLGADENWLNKPRLCSLDCTFKRGLVAGVCDGGGKRRERLRRRDKTFIFFVLTRDVDFSHAFSQTAFSTDIAPAEVKRGSEVSPLREAVL